MEYRSKMLYLWCQQQDKYYLLCTFTCERLPSHSCSEYFGVSCSNHSNVEERGCRYFLNKSYILIAKSGTAIGRTSRTVSDGPASCTTHIVFIVLMYVSIMPRILCSNNKFRMYMYVIMCTLIEWKSQNKMEKVYRMKE